MSFKKLLSVCASALMILSVGSASVNAAHASHSHNDSTKINRHLNNVKRYTHVKTVHVRNLRRVNRIKRHLINHQKNLIKLSRRINRLKRHHRNVNLIKRLNNDKNRLISAIQHNERGMLRLAKQVTNEEHQINLIRHPVAQSQANAQPTRIQFPTNQNSSVEHSVTTVINEVNGKLTKYVAKDSSAKRNGNQTRYRQFTDVNGHYSASPEQITQNEIQQLNQQIQNQIQNSNQWFNVMNREINETF